MASGSVPRVIIIGGGFGGIAAARALRRAPVEVILVDQRNHHLFQPLLYQVATASLSPGDIAEPIRSILGGQANAQVLMAEVQRIDVQHSTVWLQEQPWRYDYLVVATGVQTNYFGNDGWAAHAPGLKTVDEATAVRSACLLALEQAEMESDPRAQRAALTFAIVGAGPTGVEMAGALADIRHTWRKDFRHVDIEQMRILLVDAADRVLPTFDPKLSARALRDLRGLGVEVLLDAKVIDVDGQGLSVQDVDGSVQRIDAQNRIWAAGVRASPLGAQLGGTLDRGGRVHVGDDLTVPGQPCVFVVGDLAHRVDRKTGQPVPGVAQGAMQMGHFAGRAIAREVRATSRAAPRPPRGTFHYKDKGSLAIIGRNRAVADLAGLRFGGVPAFLVWALVHILFLIDFRQRLLVFAQWVFMYLFKERGVRLITGSGQHTSPVRPPPDPRA